VAADCIEYFLDEAFAASVTTGEDVVATARFRRRRVSLFDGSEVLQDTFPDFAAAACCFVRLARGAERTIQLVVRGVNQLDSCPSGGWLLSHFDSPAVVYWLPQPPAIRTIDSNSRILSQRNAPLAGFKASANDLRVDIRVPGDVHIDLTIWRLPADASGIRDALKSPLTIEKQPVFLRSSHTTYREPADLYLCLVHGHIYDNRFVWRRIWGGFRWRIGSENEAHSLYLAMCGLELATRRRLYTLLKRQILLSVLARQTPDGGWHHGEWTDLMESHLRLHNAGTQLLEAALEEQADDVVRTALGRAVSFVASRTDKTDVGDWFLHDTLEESAERATTPEAPPWTPTRMLGASPANKLILNTHLDAIVTMVRYARITGDTTYDAQIASARGTARAVLAMRPAEWLYGIVYRLVRLTLLPSNKARQLPLPLRAVRRLVREQVNPRLYHLKRKFPRFVMPGGLIDRHLSPKHFDMGYHPVNLMDVVRVWRCFPDEDLAAIVDGAIGAVTRTGLLEYWVETKQKQPVGYWVEALYDLSTMRETPDYRRYLAEAILCAEDAGIGLPPSLLGGNAEAVPIPDQAPCPSPVGARLRVANLSRAGALELLVVNPTTAPIELRWELHPPAELAWEEVGGRAITGVETPPSVPPRGWVLGRGRPSDAQRPV
jgi:hypothetical protein